MQRPLTLIEPPVGHVEALASIYDETAARVYGVVLRVVRDPVQAEEVTQEVYLEIWRQIVRLDVVRGSAVAWLMTVAHEMAVDRVRSVEDSRRRAVADFARRPRRDQRPATGQVGGQVETPAPAHRSQDAQAVRVALSALSVGHRQAIELAYFSGHSHAEVARRLDISPGTATDWIRDGLIQLRQSILMHDAESLVACG